MAELLFCYTGKISKGKGKMPAHTNKTVLNPSNFPHLSEFIASPKCQEQNENKTEQSLQKIKLVNHPTLMVGTSHLAPLI